MKTPAELKFKSRLASSRLRVVTTCSLRRAKRANLDEKATAEFVKNNIERYVK